MSKRSRQEKRRAAFLSRGVKGDLPIGGLFGALHRNANGQATPKDVDFLTRMRREQKGKDGYSGDTHGSRGSGDSHDYSGSGYLGYGEGGYSGGYNGGYGKGYSFTVSPPKDDGVFHCEEAGEIVKDCPLNPKVPSILIDAQMWGCLMDCTREYDTEWIALLIGRLGKDSNKEDVYLIERFYFPPQTASGTHVDVPTGIKPKVGTIGAIHSHVNMGVFFSSTDKAHSNWPVEIVINRREEYEAVSRFKLKCGEWAKAKAKVYLTGSALPKAIKSQLDAAFVAGRVLAAKGNDKGGVAGLHPEDRDDATSVSSAVIHLPNLGSVNPCKSCGHYSHTKGQKCAALECKCETYVADDGKVEKVCPVGDCIRPEGHAGYHRNNKGEYYQFKAGEGDATAKEVKGEVKGDEPKELPLTSLNPDDPTELRELEEYCPRCEGEQMVETFDVDKGMWLVETCPTCKGDGLSELGRVRQADSKVVQ